MDSPPSEALALVDRLDALTRELIPLQMQYRTWAREYQRTGVPHDRDEFNVALLRLKSLREQITHIRDALTALRVGGAK